MQRTTLELAALCGADLQGDPRLLIRGPASLEAAEPDQISFFGDSRYARELKRSRAGALVVPRGVDVGEHPAVLLRCDRPNAAFGLIFEEFGRLPSRPPVGVHETAVIGSDVVLGARVAIGPYCVIGDGVELADDVVLHAHVSVGARARIGAGSELRSSVVLYDGVSIGARCLIQSGAVVGGDGFGFDPVIGKHGIERWEKLPHGGTVEVGDDVEIGANCTVDRGRFEATRIGSGAKLDNLVHVGHNVQIGPHSLLIAQVGIAGSTRVGAGVVLAGQSGVSTHLEIGDGARIGPACKVFEDLPGHADYGGFWAQPKREWLKQTANLRRLGELMERVKVLEREVASLRGSNA